MPNSKKKVDPTTKSGNGTKPIVGRSAFVCTSCGGDATVAWANNTKADKDYFGGIIHPGERLCLSCGKKRGVGFF